MSARKALVVSLAVVAIGCDSVREELAEPSDDSVGTEQSSLFGPGVVVDGTSLAGPVSTVAQLPGCSGVLVTRDAILTSHHCVCFDTTGPRPLSDYRVSFPQDPVVGRTFSVASVVSHPEAICVPAPLGGGFLRTAVHHADLAILHLAAPVPASVVQTPARLFLGDIVSAIEGGTFTLPATQVGFGGTDASDRPPNGGIRRFGPVPKLWLEPPDPCDALIDEGWCDNDWSWQAFTGAAISGATMARGDSGGGLFMTISGGDRILVGIVSGTIPIQVWQAGSQPRQLWSPTSSPNGLTQWFIRRELGEDLDGDGALDASDNCPPEACTSRGRTAEACKNPEQFDFDGDGVGEVCDNCPASWCSMPEHVRRGECFNPSQRNTDGDAVGDTCDYCPFVPDTLLTLGLQPDDDLDGVGNACDTCPKANPYALCLTHANCGAGVTCRFDGGTSSIGHCSKPTDADGDQVPDGCDECLGFENRMKDRSNSNVLAEVRERPLHPTADIKTLSDECDAVPILRMPEQEPEAVPLTPVLGDGKGPDEKALIIGHRWLGAESRTSPTVTRDMPIQYRHCTCFDASGAPIGDLEECVDRLCPVANPLASSAWTNMTIEADPLDPAGTALIPASGSAPQRFQTLNSFDFHRFWRWRSDLTSGVVRGKGNCASGQCETRGIVFARVVRGAENLGSRDNLGLLRDTFQMYRTPNFRIERPPSSVPPGVPCTKASCAGWIDPTKVVRDPSIDDLNTRLTQPGIIGSQNGNAFVVRGPTDVIDVTAHVSPGIRIVLESDPSLRQWLTPVEAGYRVRNTPGASGVAGVVLGNSIDASSRPAKVQIGSNGMQIVGEGGGEQGLAVLSGGPPSRTGVFGAYSAIEGAVYVAGGKVADGRPAATIWKYLTSSESWSLLSRTGIYTPGSKVLAMAYDQPNARLFVLDLDDEITAVPKRARLVQYELGAATSRLVATWPYFGILRPFVSATDDGRVLLTVAGATTFSVWRYNPTPLGLLFEGVLLGTGTVYDQPMMGDTDLVLPVLRQGRVNYETLSRSRFLPGLPCTSL